MKTLKRYYYHWKIKLIKKALFDFYYYDGFKRIEIFGKKVN